jgi:predicted ATPase
MLDFAINNFRIFKERETILSLKDLNILTGTNNSGKSTLVKFVLLLQDALFSSDMPDLRFVTGKYNLGDFDKNKNLFSTSSNSFSVLFKADFDETNEEHLQQSFYFEYVFKKKKNDLERAELSEFRIWLFEGNPFFILRKNSDEKYIVEDDDGEELQDKEITHSIHIEVFQFYHFLIQFIGLGANLDFLENYRETKIQEIHQSKEEDLNSNEDKKEKELTDLESKNFSDEEEKNQREEVEQDFFYNNEKIEQFAKDRIENENAMYQIAFDKFQQKYTQLNQSNECFNTEQLNINYQNEANYVFSKISWTERYFKKYTLKKLNEIITGSSPTESLVKFRDIASKIQAFDHYIYDAIEKELQSRDDDKKQEEYLNEIFEKAFNNVLFTLQHFKNKNFYHVSSVLDLKSRFIPDNNNNKFLLDFLQIKEKSGSFAERIKVQIMSALKPFETIDDFEVKREINSGFRVILYKNDQPINLSDWGDGIKHIFSIIMQVIILANLETERKASIFMIEEPEVHLHPKTQSYLANFFIDTIEKNPEVKFIIETHSEYLIRKLQFLVADRHTELASKIMLFYFGENEIKQLEINENGNIKGEFGTGFFDESSRQITGLWKIQRK